LSLSVARLGDGDYFNPRSYWFLDNDGLHADHPVGYAHNASLFRRSRGSAAIPRRVWGPTPRSTLPSSGWRKGSIRSE
jgi:hypothetical protein